MLRLYDYLPSGNGYKVRLLLHQLGIPFERVELDIVRGETRTPEFLARNPNGRIPTLELEDGTHLAESNAILWYLGDGTRFVPDDPYERAKALQWLFFEQYEHEPAIAVARFLKTYYGRPEVWEAQREQLTKRGVKALRALEEGLAEREWLVGGAMSIADVSLYAYTHAADEGGFSLEDLPSIRAWLERVASQPGHVPMQQAN
jgi:glutathione S-transferase